MRVALVNLDSVDAPAGNMTVVLGSSGTASPGVARLTAEELPRVRRSIDAGRPVVLGLVGARHLDQVARNRQVVAYGYDDEGAGPGGPPMRLFVYDSHHPDTEVTLEEDPDRGHWETSAGDGPWRGLFVQDYVRERPPYIDLGAAKGIWVNSWTPTLGGNFVAQFTARNYGEYRAHLSELRLAVRGPAGENLDRFLGGDGDPTPLEPGEERAVFKASDAFGTVAGSYAVAAGYLSEQGCWLGIPPGEPGAVDEVGVTVIPPPRRARVTVTFAAVTVEDAEALGGRLALRLAVGDQAARWPEEGAVDVQDGVADLFRLAETTHPSRATWRAHALHGLATLAAQCLQHEVEARLLPLAAPVADQVKSVKARRRPWSGSASA